MIIFYEKWILTKVWSDELVLEFHKRVRNNVVEAGIPIVWQKSSSPTVEVTEMPPFIVHKIDLTDLPKPASSEKWKNRKFDLEN